MTNDKRTTRTHFVYRIDIWTNDGKNIVEHLAGLENLIVARAFGVTLPTAPTLNAEFEIITSAIYGAADQPRPIPVTNDKRTTRTHFVYRIDIWTNDGKNIVEHLAGLENLIVARAAYRAACERWPNATITLRQGARVVEDNRRRQSPVGRI